MVNQNKIFSFTIKCQSKSKTNVFPGDEEMTAIIISTDRIVEWCSIYQQTEELSVCAGWSETEELSVCAGWSETEELSVCAGWSETEELSVCAGWSETEELSVCAGWSETVFTLCKLMSLSYQANLADIQGWNKVVLVLMQQWYMYDCVFAKEAACI